MAKKPYTVEKEINDVKYVAQFNGISAALEAADNSYLDDSSNFSALKMSKYLLDHVIVEPKGLTVDDFDSLEELNAVTAFARKVMQGEFRKEEEQVAANKKG